MLPEPGTLEHTQLTWSLMPFPTANTVLRYVAMDKKRGTLVGDFARTPEELHEAMLAYNVDGCNFYIQLNPTEVLNKSKTNKFDISNWSWFLLDIDPIDVAGYKPGILLDLAIEKLQTEIGRFLFPTIVYSGRGVQAWFRIPDIKLHDGDSLSIDETGVSRFTARQSMGYWLRHLADRSGVVAGCRVDPCTSDLPRIMRMPGSINYSTGNRAMILRVGDFNTTLAEDLVMNTPAESFVTPVIQAFEGDMTWQQAMSRVTKKAHDFCLFGWASPGRHEAMWHTLMSLKEVGVSKEEAIKGVMSGNRWCTVGDRTEPLAASEILNTAAKVYLDTTE